jgi:hypothetical protein
MQLAPQMILLANIYLTIHNISQHQLIETKREKNKLRGTDRVTINSINILFPNSIQKFHQKAFASRAYRGGYHSVQ